ncbi:very low-density lipoprotein receptor-like protein [Chrysochromulina tobinii]|uniref:Very low-density lipoprotein receptor-like protein n=1 Tax=Chrysochromulina tobinii TaxID=1460289 RepID=A0A0M0JP74_9EUKA|nr:very low-density lipoprotein receptor-like protein [Chrysochromulina tobinii]|eukprot:KOO28394.1 very low-density lipoprotein receptor-like protein [Chrysochromulina sp. CCMP291]
MPIECDASTGVAASVTMPADLMSGIPGMDASHPVVAVLYASRVNLHGGLFGNGAAEGRRRSLRRRLMSESAPTEPPLCSDTCTFASDAECDDGGAGAEYFLDCTYGTDCEDCGPRAASGGGGDLDGNVGNGMAAGPSISFKLMQQGIELVVEDLAMPINISLAYQSLAAVRGRPPCVGAPDPSSDAARACATTVECRFWNETNSSWSTDGCMTTMDDEGSIGCSCLHLTEFIAFEFPTTVEQLRETALSAVAFNRLESRALECAIDPARSWRTVRPIWDCFIGLMTMLIVTLIYAEQGQTEGSSGGERGGGDSLSVLEGPDAVFDAIPSSTGARNTRTTIDESHAATAIQRRWKRAQAKQHAHLQVEVITKRWHQDVNAMWKRVCIACMANHSLCAGFLTRGVAGFTRAQTMMMLFNGFAFELVMLSLFYESPPTPPVDNITGLPMEEAGPAVVINPVAIIISATVAAIICIPMGLIFGWVFDPIILVNDAKLASECIAKAGHGPMKLKVDATRSWLPRRQRAGTRQESVKGAIVEAADEIRGAAPRELAKTTRADEEHQGSSTIVEAIVPKAIVPEANTSDYVLVFDHDTATTSERVLKVEDSALASPPPPAMRVISFTLKCAGDISTFASSVQTEIASAIAAQAGVQPSAVEVTVTSGSVIVDAKIRTPTATATSVLSKMADATSSASSASEMLMKVTGIEIAVQTRLATQPRTFSYASLSDGLLKASLTYNWKMKNWAIVRKILLGWTLSFTLFGAMCFTIFLYGCQLFEPYIYEGEGGGESGRRLTQKRVRPGDENNDEDQASSPNQ